MPSSCCLIPGFGQPFRASYMKMKININNRGYILGRRSQTLPSLILLLRMISLNSWNRSKLYKDFLANPKKTGVFQELKRQGWGAIMTPFLISTLDRLTGNKFYMCIDLDGGIPIDRRSDRPIIEKGPIDRGSDRPIIEKGPIDRGSDRPIIGKGPIDRGSDRPIIGKGQIDRGSYRPNVR